jgi:O-acetyl-ADP-ribose deacetylase (regulator of RNase III)
MLDRVKRPDRGRARCGMAVSASAVKNNMAMIIITPTAVWRGRFDVRHDVAEGRSPYSILEARRPRRFLLALSGATRLSLGLRETVPGRAA